MTEMSGRRALTFSQAEGIDPLPTQLKPRFLSKEIRARIWVVIYAALKNELSAERDIYGNRYQIGGAWLNVLSRWWVLVDHKMIDEFPLSYEYWISDLKKKISSDSYNRVFDFLEYALRQSPPPTGLERGLADALIEGRSAYRLIDGDMIVPLALEGETTAVSKALSDVGEAQYHGAKSHLRAAVAALNDGDFAGSVRESIHAVDGVARSLAPSATDLGPALSELERSGYIHGAMKSGFAKLYGYSSNEKGVRHALIEDGAPKVTEVDAIYMIGSCSAFISYLIGKAREFGVEMIST